MVARVRIGGDVDKLRALGRLMREVPDKELKRELFKAVQRATKPVKAEIRQSALDTLPSSGGLNVWVSNISIRTKQSYSGRFPGVTITGTKNNKGRTKGRTFGASADLRSINRGRIFHPVFGHGPLVGPQGVEAGFWDKPLKGVTTQRAKREIRQAMQTTTKLLAARIRSAA